MPSDGAPADTASAHERHALRAGTGGAAFGGFGEGAVAGTSVDDTLRARIDRGIVVPPSGGPWRFPDKRGFLLGPDTWWEYKGYLMGSLPFNNVPITERPVVKELENASANDTEPGAALPSLPGGR